MKIQAVFFDMGGTLETLETSDQIRFASLPAIKDKLHSAGILPSLGDEELFTMITQGLDNYHRESIPTRDESTPFRVWREFIFAGQNINDEALDSIAEELMYLVESRFYIHTLRPEVPEVLKTLKERGLKIGLISNVNSRTLVPALLENYGIADYFHPVVLSSEYRRRKPDPAIFHYAARLAGVATGRSVFVGDKLSRDIAGARSAGFALAIQIQHNLKNSESDSGPVPDAVIDHMGELPEILKAAESSSHTKGRDGRKIKALLFDAGDILYYRPEKKKYFRVFLAEQNAAGREIAVNQVEALRDMAFRGELTQERQRRETILLYGFTDEETIARGCEALAKDNSNVRFFEGVRETLITLKKRGFQLGIITDTANPIHVKLSWFEQGGFVHVWDSLISSQEMGVEKPDPAIYRAALDQLGIDETQAVFVGHSGEELEGARRCGVQTVAFNYEDTVQADYYLDKFADLLNLPFTGEY